MKVTYEVQPPSYTSLKLLTGPTRGGGGDTIWSSQYAAYDALSSHMQTYLKGLTALHSADMQAQNSRAIGRAVRREPVTTEHPLIRTNPVTGWNALFFNPGFVTKIVGVPKIESDSIIRYLTEMISTTQEMHVRFQWRRNDVAFWDNRSTVSCIHWLQYSFSKRELTQQRSIQLRTGLLRIADMRCALRHKQNVLTWIILANLKRMSLLFSTACQRLIRMDHASPTTMTSSI
jgi:alpha-ketoglutarate-dependent taurine dioxygenase